MIKSCYITLNNIPFLKKSKIFHIRNHFCRNSIKPGFQFSGIGIKSLDYTSNCCLIFLWTKVTNFHGLSFSIGKMTVRHLLHLIHSTSFMTKQGNILNLGKHYTSERYHYYFLIMASTSSQIANDTKNTMVINI